MIYTYTFRKQSKFRGYFASVTFNIIFDESKKKNLIISYLADLKWEVPCKAAINMFLERHPFTGELIITIQQIDWLPVDTNSTVVIYSTLKGLCEFFSKN